MTTRTETDKPRSEPHADPTAEMRATRREAAEREVRAEPRRGADAQRRGAFRVTVTKDYLTFASAHFITFEGHRCETLHGHNYRVGVVCEGALNLETWYVFDFGVLKKLMKRLCDEIDHKVLLPTQSPKVALGEQGSSITVAVNGEPRYVFPKKDCVLLALPNTTVEMLAKYLAGKLRTEVVSSAAAALTAIEIEVEESFGQSAIYREEMAE
jgi:6-pyruvoyltetrahydropterin/6-carboxytetrahydropterin synthase